MRRRHVWERALACALAFVMAWGGMPTQALAQMADEASAAVVEQTAEETDVAVVEQTEDETLEKDYAADADATTPANKVAELARAAAQELRTAAAGRADLADRGEHERLAVALLDATVANLAWRDDALSLAAEADATALYRELAGLEADAEVPAFAALRELLGASLARESVTDALVRVAAELELESAQVAGANDTRWLMLYLGDAWHHADVASAARAIAERGDAKAADTARAWLLISDDALTKLDAARAPWLLADGSDAPRAEIAATDNEVVDGDEQDVSESAGESHETSTQGENASDGQSPTPSSQSIVSVMGGDGFTWQLTRNEINVYGSGKMTDRWIDKMDYSRLMYCSDYMTVNLNGDITEIAPGAFDGCGERIYYLNFECGNSLKKIGELAFNYIRASQISLPEGLEVIDVDAFSCAERLSWIYIPSTVKSINLGAFALCTNLQTVMYGGSKSDWEKITIGDRNTYLTGAEIVFAKEDTLSGTCGPKLKWSYDNGKLTITGTGEMTSHPWTTEHNLTGKITSVTIQSGATSIAAEAFKDCTALTSASIPSSVTSIGMAAFRGCASLNSGVVPGGIGLDGVTSIYGYAFYGCTSLTKVSLSMLLKNVGQYAFHGCGSLAEASYAGTKAMWDKVVVGTFNQPLLNALQYLDAKNGTCGPNLKWSYNNGKLTIAGSGEMTSHPWTALGLQSSITEVSLSTAATSIADGAFAGCSSLKSLDLSSMKLTNTSLKDLCSGCKAMERFSARGADFSKVTSTASMFYGCERLKSVDFAECDLGNVSAATSMYAGCTSLESFTIGSTNAWSYRSYENGAIPSAQSSNGMWWSVNDRLWYTPEKIATFPATRVDKYTKTEVWENKSGFDLTKFGHIVINREACFGYDNNYKIPLERYQEVFGAKFTQAIYDQIARTWAGNCAGMSWTSALFYEGRLRVADYTNTSSLKDGSYATLMQPSNSKAYVRLEKDAALTRLIEQYQVWDNNSAEQISMMVKASEAAQRSNKIMFENAMSDIRAGKTLSLSVEWYSKSYNKSVGHALLTDSCRKPRDLGNGWYRIFLCDPNNPYYDYGGSAQLSSCYANALERYIDVNTASGDWTMEVIANGADTPETIYHDSDDYSTSDDASERYSVLNFAPIDDVPNSFATKATYGNDKTIKYSSNTITVTDTDTGRVVFSLIDGRIQHVDGEVTHVTNEQSPNVSTGTLSLPNNINKYIVSVNAGTASFAAGGNYVGMQSDSAFTVSGVGSTSASVMSKVGASVNVVIESVSGSKFTCASTDVLASSEETSLSLSGNTFVAQSTKGQTLDVKITDDTGRNTSSKVAVKTPAVSLASANVSIGGLSNQKYTGEPIKPKPIVNVNDRILTLNTDYTLSYKNNTNVGTASVTIQGINNYTGSKTVTFQIVTTQQLSAAVLYADGELVLQGDRQTDSSRTVTKVWYDGMTTGYKVADSMPWKSSEYSSRIKKLSTKGSVSIDSGYMFFEGLTALEQANLSGLDVSDVTTLCAMFQGCTNMWSVDTTGWDTSNVVNMKSVFINCENLLELKGVWEWNTSKVTNMCSMFGNCHKMAWVDTSAWDTSNVQDMSYMFAYCWFTASWSIASMDTSSCTNMKGMFYDCEYMGDDKRAVDFSQWDTSKVTSMEGMFESCRRLGNAKGIDRWNTSNVTTMKKMFYECVALWTLDLSGWNTAKLIDASDMFTSCRSLTTVTVGKNYSASKAFPAATATNSKWWSQGAQKWFTVQEISSSRSGIVDTYTDEQILDISTATITGASAQTYTGSAIRPTPTVQLNGKTLTLGTDYTLSYTDNTNVGTAVVTIKGKGAYTGTRQVAFLIAAKKTSPTLTLSSSSYAYNGRQQKPNVTVKDGSSLLKEGIDYSIVWPAGCTSAGSYDVQVNCNGNRVGTAKASFRINAIDLSGVSVSGIANQTFKGSAWTPKPTVKHGSAMLKEDTDYTLSYANNVNAGAASVTITGKGNYAGIKTVTFNIDPIDLSGVSVSGIANQTFKGSAWTPKPTVKHGSATLKEGTDYTLSYANNVNAGTASVTITGKGNYTGTQTATFAIAKAPNGLAAKAGAAAEVLFSKVKKKAQAVASGVSVSGAQGAVSYRKVSGAAQLTVDTRTGKITVRKGSKKGTYRAVVRVTAAGDANHGASSRDVTVTVKVVAKLTNPMSATGKRATVKAGKSIAAKKLVTVKSAKGKVTYRKASGNKGITVAANGKVTVKKGTKRGTYKIKVKVTAAGNASYKKATKTATCTVVVR